MELITDTVWGNLLVQFGVISTAAGVCAEFWTLPLGKPGPYTGGAVPGLLARKRVNALIYALIYSIIAWRMGLVNLPEMALNGSPWYIQVPIVFFLSLLSMALAGAVAQGKKKLTA